MTNRTIEPTSEEVEVAVEIPENDVEVGAVAFS